MAERLAPGGLRRGRYYVAKNPTRNDREAGSFVVWIDGGAPGAWKDYATGDKGDVIDLVGYCLGLDRRDAIDWARDYLGLDRLDPAARERMRRSAARHEADRRCGEAERQARAVRSASALWFASQPSLIGTEAEAYFAGRAIDLGQLPRQPRALRFRPALEYVRLRETDAGRIVRPGPCFPAIVAAMVDSAGVITAAHRTFLAPGGAGKAPVEKAKLMLGAAQGTAIRLWRGRSGLSPEEAAKTGRRDPLVWLEGIEDGLSVAFACPELRVWAAGSLDNIGRLVVPACASEIIVVRDNDWGKPEAIRQFERAMDALERDGRRAGVPVKVTAATTGKDINDQLRGAA